MILHDVGESQRFKTHLSNVTNIPGSQICDSWVEHFYKLKLFAVATSNEHQHLEKSLHWFSLSSAQPCCATNWFHIVLIRMTTQTRPLSLRSQNKVFHSYWYMELSWKFGSMWSLFQTAWTGWLYCAKGSAPERTKRSPPLTSVQFNDWLDSALG